MSATTSTTEDPGLHDYLVSGETCFVSGAVLALVSDFILTFRSLVIPNWIGFTLGMVYIVVTMYLLNWLYTGKKEARFPTLVWCGVQILIAAIGVALLLNREFRLDYRFYRIGDVLPQALSVSAPYFGLFKIAAYGLFAYLITQRGPALFFLRHKGGEHVEAPSPTTPPEDIHPTGAVLPLTADQSDKADRLANTLQNAGIALMAAGFFLAIVGGQRIATTPRLGWITLGEGVVLLLIGLLAFNPIAALRNIKDRGADTAYVTDAASKVGGMINKQVILALLLAALTIGGVVLRVIR